MSKLDNILGLYNPVGPMLTTERKEKIKDLFLELVGDDIVVDDSMDESEKIAYNMRGREIIERINLQ